MKIYKDYTTYELLLDEPCIHKDFTLYPIRVRDYMRFSKYAVYLVNSKQHLGAKDSKESLLKLLISIMAQSKLENTKGTLEDRNLAIKETVQEIEDMITLLVKKKVKFQQTSEGEIEFVHYDSKGIADIVINEANYNDFRRIVMSMNLLQEDIVFEEAEMREYYYRYKEGMSRKNKIGLEEIIISVSKDTGFFIDKIKEMSFFQLKCYYHRLVDESNANTSRLFATVSEKQKIEDLIAPIIKPLYAKESMNDLFTDADELSKLL